MARLWRTPVLPALLTPPTLLQVTRSAIYYHHLGNQVFEDSFQVVLSDLQEPPNLSEAQVGQGSL